MSATDLARLIDANAAPLVLYARQWCEAAEDVVQEAFLKLVRQSRPPVDVVAWLYRVVRKPRCFRWYFCGRTRPRAAAG